MNLEKLDEILAVDEGIRYVALIDSKGNLITSKSKPTVSQIIIDVNAEYVLDLCITKQMMDIFNTQFGKPLSMLIRRENTKQLIYYHDYMIIYVSCEHNISEDRMTIMSQKIDKLVKELTK